MILVVPFVIASGSDIRWRWLAVGALGTEQSANVAQIGSMYLWRIDAGTPPTGAEELIVYDVNDPTHFATGGYKAQVIYDKLTVGPPDEPIIIIPGASAPNQITAHTTTRDQYGIIEPNITLTFQLTTAASGRNSSYATPLFHVTSDSNGSLAVALEKGAGYQVRRGRKGEWIQFTATGSGPTFELPEAIGIP